MFVAHYHFCFLRFGNKVKACHMALLFIAIMLTLFETTVLLLVGGRFLRFFLNMDAAALIPHHLPCQFYCALPSGRQHGMT